MCGNGRASIPILDYSYQRYIIYSRQMRDVGQGRMGRQPIQVELLRQVHRLAGQRPTFHYKFKIYPGLSKPCEKLHDRPSGKLPFRWASMQVEADGGKLPRPSASIEPFDKRETQNTCVRAEHLHGLRKLEPVSKGLCEISSTQPIERLLFKAEIGAQDTGRATMRAILRAAKPFESEFQASIEPFLLRQSQSESRASGCTVIKESRYSFLATRPGRKIDSNADLTSLCSKPFGKCFTQSGGERKSLVPASSIW